MKQSIQETYRVAVVLVLDVVNVVIGII